MVNIKQQQTIELMIDAELRVSKGKGYILMTRGNAHIALGNLKTVGTLCISGLTGFI